MTDQEAFALIYTIKQSDWDTTPEQLLAMYRAAKIKFNEVADKISKENKKNNFSFE